MSGEGGTATPKVALVVVAGVGDDERGSCVRSLGKVLAGLGGYEAGGEGTLVVPVRPSDWGRDEGGTGVYDAFRLPMTRSHSEEGQDPVPVEVDLIEMRWSDLSQFPGKLRAFTATLFGLSLQVSTPGLEALVSFRKERFRDPEVAWLNWAIAAGTVGLVAGLGLACSHGAGLGMLLGLASFVAVLLIALGLARGGSLAGIAHSLNETSSWLLAAIVVPTSVVTGLAAVTFWLTVDRALKVPDAAALPTVAAGGLLLVLAVGKALRDGGWSYGNRGPWRRVADPRIWMCAAFLGWLAIEIWKWTVTDSPVAGSAQALAYFGGWASRATWLGAISVTSAALIAILLSWPMAGSRTAERDTPGRDARHRTLLGRLRDRLMSGSGRSDAELSTDDARYRTAALTAALSPLLIAIFAAVLFAGVAGFAFQTADNARWGKDITDVKCFSESSSWSPGPRCGDDRERASSVAARVSGWISDAKASETAAAQSRRDGDETAADAADERAELLRSQASKLEQEAGATPADWARHLLALNLLPVSNAATIAVAFLLALGLASALIALWVRWRYRGENAHRRGRGLTRTLRLAATSPGVLVAAALYVAFSAWWIWWPFTGSSGLQGLGLATTIWDDPARSTAITLAGVGLALVLVVGRFLPVDPRNLTGTVGGALEVVRRYLDLPYDVATYVRIYRGGEGPRPEIMARYRALLRRVAEKGYDRVVIAAHSQGSMLTATVFFGDRSRRDPESAPGDASGADDPYEGWGVRPWRSLPPAAPDLRRVWLLTFGCPVRQTYGARFPGQYDAVWEAPEGGPRQWEDEHAPVGLWVNVYRPRDYIGRAVFNDPLREDTLEEKAVRRHGTLPSLPVRDVCLAGRGSHTGYFGDPELAKWVDWMVHQAIHDRSYVPAPPDYPATYHPWVPGGSG